MSHAGSERKLAVSYALQRAHTHSRAPPPTQRSAAVNETFAKYQVILTQFKCERRSAKDKRREVAEEVVQFRVNTDQLQYSYIYDTSYYVLWRWEAVNYGHCGDYYIYEYIHICKAISHTREGIRKAKHIHKYQTPTQRDDDFITHRGDRNNISSRGYNLVEV